MERYEYENKYYNLGYDYIIGLDEAGRGLTANSNTQDADMADSIRGVLRRSRINRVMKIGVNDKKSVGSVKANMVVRINVIVSSF